MVSQMAKYGADLDLIFAALSDPTRRATIARLVHGPASVSELAAPHDMALPSFLGHLGKLEKAGLIQSTKNGRVRSYQLTKEALLPAQNWLAEQNRLWQTRLDQLDEYVMNLIKEKDHES